MGVAFWVELLVVVGAIVMGVRMGGIGLGIWGVVGVAILVWVFGLAPGSPPTSAILIILAVITAAAAMQVAGGIDYLVSLATKLIERNPKRINYVAPIVSWGFTVGAGTSNIFYPLLPVIYQTAYENDIRPERPLATSTVANALGITCSPVSAAMAAMLTLTDVEKYGNFGLGKILFITIPASIVAIIVMALVQNFIGKPLAEDPIYQQRLRDGLVKPPAHAQVPALAAVGSEEVAIEGDSETNGFLLSASSSGGSSAGTAVLERSLATQAAVAAAPTETVTTGGPGGPREESAGGGNGKPELPKGAALSAYLFLGGVIMIVLTSTVPFLQKMVPGPEGEPVKLDSTTIIQLTMFIVALLIVVLCKINPVDITRQQVFGAGIIALLALFGIAWLADTFIATYNEQISNALSNWVTAVPLLFAFAIFLLAMLTTSQSATTRTLVPIALAIPLPVASVVAMWQAVSGVLFLPANGTQLAAVAVDQTGTTKIGKAVVNHSFMIPLLVATVAAVLVGLVIAVFVG